VIINCVESSLAREAMKLDSSSLWFARDSPDKQQNYQRKVRVLHSVLSPSSRHLLDVLQKRSNRLSIPTKNLSCKHFDDRHDSICFDLDDSVAIGLLRES